MSDTSIGPIHGPHLPSMCQYAWRAHGTLADFIQCGQPYGHTDHHVRGIHSHSRDEYGCDRPPLRRVLVTDYALSPFCQG